MEEAAELNNYQSLSFKTRSKQNSIVFLDAFRDLKQQDLNNNIVSFVSKVL